MQYVDGKQLAVENGYLCIHVVFIQQATVEQTQQPSLALGNTSLVFIRYKVTADEMIFVNRECGQQEDEGIYPSSMLIGDVNERVDNKAKDDVLCKALPRQLDVVSSDMFGDAGEFVSVQERDDSETQNSRDQESNMSTVLKSPVIAKTYSCNLCRKTFSSSSSSKILLENSKHRI